MKLGVHELTVDKSGDVWYSGNIPAQHPDYIKSYVYTILTVDEKYRLLTVLTDIAKDRRKKDIDIIHGV